MPKFIPEFHNYSYLIMAASEREERGGAIAYRGAYEFVNRVWEYWPTERVCLSCTAAIPIKCEVNSRGVCGPSFSGSVYAEFRSFFPVKMPKSKRNRAGKFIWNLFAVKDLMLELCNPFVYWIVVAYSGSTWWLLQATCKLSCDSEAQDFGAAIVLHNGGFPCLCLLMADYVPVCFFLSHCFWFWQCTKPETHKGLKRVTLIRFALSDARDDSFSKVPYLEREEETTDQSNFVNNVT